MIKLGSRKFHICPKVTKMESIICHRIDFVQASIFFRISFHNRLVVCITAMINHILTSYHSQQCRDMNFPIFTCILHLLRVCIYHALSKWPTPSWLDSSVDNGALHRYSRGHGFESRSGLNGLLKSYA